MLPGFFVQMQGLMVKASPYIGWADRSEDQHSHESQSLGFATLSANLQNSNACNQPNLPRYTLVFNRGGKVVQHKLGAMSRAEIRAAIEAAGK